MAIEKIGTFTPEQIPILNELLRQLDDGKFSVKYFTAVPTTSTLNKGEIGVYDDGAGTRRVYIVSSSDNLVTLNESVTVTASDTTITVTGGSAIKVNLAHDAFVKGWVTYQQTGTPAVLDSYNVTSVNDDSAGQITITWATDFADTNYCLVATGGNTAGGIDAGAMLEARAAGTSTIQFVSGGNPEDLNYECVIGIGDQ